MHQCWRGLRRESCRFAYKRVLRARPAAAIIRRVGKRDVLRTMAQRVFVKVIGFSDVERHALNTVFRLSEERYTTYSLWMPDAPEPPALVLVDEMSYLAQVELASPTVDARIVWVGASPPVDVWRSFQRPLAWSEVVGAMDALFVPPLRDGEVDSDVDDSMADTLPPEPDEPGKRALIVCADPDVRLYLRAKLALADLTQADEAETGAYALELLRYNAYAVAVVDFALPDVDGWALLKQLGECRPPIPHVIITKSRPTFGERVRAWFAGAEGVFERPPHPGKLHELLLKV